MRFVDASLRVVERILKIWIASEGIRVHTLFGEANTDGKGITDDEVLWKAAKLGQSQNFTNVVNQTSQVEPVVLRILSAQSFGSLESVDRLAKVKVGITFIDNGI